MAPLGGGSAELTLRHLDTLASAHVLLLGASAFSELGASLNGRGLKLAPAHVWEGLSARVPGAINLSYPSGAHLTLPP